MKLSLCCWSVTLAATFALEKDNTRADRLVVLGAGFSGSDHECCVGRCSRVTC